MKALLGHMWRDLDRVVTYLAEPAPEVTAGGSAVTREILVGLLGAEPPAALGWDDLTFIETGTGRRPLTPEDRDILGDRTAGFPLLA